MADTHHAANGHGDSQFKAYMGVALLLSLFTASSFVFNLMARRDVITHFQSFVLILGVAIVKASLVAWIFMHLKWDWRLLYYLIFPAFILGAMMMVVLMPDILLGPMHDNVDEINIRNLETASDHK